MLKFGNKEFNNLQEQVLENANDILEIKQSLGTALPNPIIGPQGPVGPQGPQGVPGQNVNFTIGTDLPASANNGDLHLKFNGELYQYVNNTWVLQTSLKGPQGVQGPRGLKGEQGPKGEQGIQGEQGKASTVYQVVGRVDSISQLPAPSTVATNSAYIVGTEIPYTLYIIVGTSDSNAVWESMGTFSINQINVDDALSTTSINPVQNQVITNKINTFNQYFENINLFNPTTATSGAFLQANGIPLTAAAYYYSDFIPVEVGQTYTWKFHEGTKGVAYNGNKELVLAITATNTVTNDPYSSFTVPNGVSYIRVNGRAIPKESQMVIKCTIEDYPQVYIPYGTELVNIKFGAELTSEINGLITEKVPGTETIQSRNLLDLSKVEWGSYLKEDGSIGTYSGGGISDYIPIDATKSYMFPVNTAFYGSASVNIQLYDKDKTRIGRLMGASTGVSVIDFTSEDYGSYKVFITGALNTRAEFIGAKYARITAFNNVPPYAAGYVSKFMMVEGNDINQYPRTFQEYEYYKVLDNIYSLNDTQIAKVEELVTQNVLSGKKILFDGDSICEATSAGVNDGGWAKRIGEANNMVWYNHGVSGGTITDIPGDRDRHIISTSWQNYPTDLDYIILEGGTNDADNINGDEALIGTFSMTDWSGNYDYTTFCGAMEYMIYNIQQKYPHAKLGYIVAQKMGYSSTSICNYSTGTPRYDIFTLAMQICKKWGIPVINLWDESGFNPMISSQYLRGATNEENVQRGSLYKDGQHLTAVGYDKLSTQIDAFVKSI